jgi:hypothetical protein
MRILGPIILCALARRIVLPVEIRAGKLSLQPEAIGADQEATNDLKGSGANGRIWPAMMSAELPEGWA